jgi:hypothetical protein
MRLLNLQDNNNFQISAPQYPTHYTPSGNGDVLDIVLHKNTRLSEVNVLEILDSDYLPMLFYMLDHVSTRDISAPIEIFTDWERFQNVASEIISPRVQIQSIEDAEETACKFTASIVSAYRLSTQKITLSDLKEELPELERLRQLKNRLRKLWQEARDPACKTAVNWITKRIRRMTQKKLKEQWDTKMGNCKVTPQAIWPMAKAMLKRDSPKAPTVIHGYSGLKFLPLEKASAIADCLENRFIQHVLCEENHERQVEITVQDTLETEDTDPPEKIKPCDLKKLIETLKLKKACGIDGILNDCLRHLPRRPLIHLTHLLNHCLRLSYFPSSWKETKIITLPKAGKDPKFPQNLRLISPLPTTGELFEKVIQKIIQKYIDANNLLNANQFVFRVSHSTTFQCMRLTDHITLSFNNNMSTAAVFLDIESAFDTTWHTGLLYKIAKFPVCLIKLINSYLLNKKFRVSVEGEMSTPRVMQAGVPQGSVLAPILYNLYINNIP